ncbi:hypothetical protein SK128_012286 [Halocaridina rubra]|uniref:Uncharacterized protein n=1 Tax=Halocaridina rubra TaxID=373956 RepID=A0AAN8XIV3_HALRR
METDSFVLAGTHRVTPQSVKSTGCRNLTACIALQAWRQTNFTKHISNNYEICRVVGGHEAGERYNERDLESGGVGERYIEGELEVGDVGERYIEGDLEVGNWELGDDGEY